MLEELKQEAYEANLALSTHGLVQLNFGNASAIDRAEGIIAIKPSGVRYARLRPMDMVLIDLQGNCVEGTLRPSSDTATHLELYRGFRLIGGVVHTHSLYATVFAQAGISIPALGTTHSDFFHGDVPVTRKLTPEEIAGDYELETGRVIRERFANLDPMEMPAALVNRHAPFTWGATSAKAVEHALALELCAQMALYTLRLSETISPVEAELLERHFSRKHGPKAYYGQVP